MRFKSARIGGFQVFAVAGVNTVSFGIDAGTRARRGLLGFAVERVDPVEDERYFLPGFKVFPSILPHPPSYEAVSTWEHPIQSFVWDDFTAKPDRDYEYIFYPIKGTPKNLDRRAAPLAIRIHTEPLFSRLEHDVFFNRGVASSQAYRRRFRNKRPDQLPPGRREEALQWLTRELDEALLLFIADAQRGDTLLCCFYEFRYQPAADALKAAIDRGVTVRLIVDGKVNAVRNKRGLVVTPSFPREDNVRTIAAASLPASQVILRQNRPHDIQHNKFMVRLKGARQQPVEVWTGSTNLSLGGFSGQTNVGHRVRNPHVAALFRDYWQILSHDPGAAPGDTPAAARQKNATFRQDVAALQAVPASIDDIPKGVTPLFSPRTGLSLLDLYVRLTDTAERCACVTLAFGINSAFKRQLQDNTRQSHIVFLLLEKKDKPRPGATQAFVAINASNNVYKAWGSFIQDPVYQWARETNAALLGLNKHVSYVHSKFLLHDPLGADPIVVTGSANFSEPSVNANDENMLIVRGDRRVADIYFTEFNRLFNHYYFRSIVEQSQPKPPAADSRGTFNESLFLFETDQWLKKYQPGKLKAKRLKLFTGMKGFARKKRGA